MPKAERGTPKDIANRAKSKGLQKLKFYCQMCQKQCRVANGMKCHETSEGHLRQMRIFSENSGGIVDTFSKDFEDYFLDSLKRRHGVKRVRANLVYNELIADKHHVHMNSTMWSSLTVFVQYLGKKGICIVDESERGWFVQYIERDVVKLAKAATTKEREIKEREEEERSQRRMQKSMLEASRAAEEEGGWGEKEATKLGERKEGERVEIGIKGGGGGGGGGEAEQGLKRKCAFDDDDEEDNDNDNEEENNRNSNGNSKVSALDSIMNANKHRSAVEEQEKQKKKPKKEKEKEKKKEKEKSKIKKHWLHVGIVVKVVSKDVGKLHYKSKGVVVEVVDRFAAKVTMISDESVVILLDQDDLRTVVGKVGEKVKIVNGEGRGKVAILEEIRVEEFVCRLKLVEGAGGVVDGVEYEHFSKLHV